MFWRVVLDLFSLGCNEVPGNEFWGLAWFWTTCILMLRVVFQFCWRIRMICLVLELVGSWMQLCFSVGMETFG